LLKPEVTSRINGYTFHWEKEAIIAQVSHCHTHRDGRVTGDLIITNDNTDKPLILLPSTQFNFSSDVTRSRQAKSLADKYNLPLVNWVELFDYLGHHVQELAKKGTPAVELCTSEEITAPKYLLEPLIIENYPNIIFGDPSAFKSNLAVMITQVLQLPWDDNPLGLTAPDGSIRCLYLDWEQDENTIIWLANLLEKSYNIGPLSVFYRHCDSPLAEDTEKIEEYAIETKARVLIIDSLGLAAGSELKETKPALEFYRAVRQINITSLILAHNSKDRETKQRTVYGNQYFQAQARNVWEIRKSQEVGSNELDIALFHRKPPPFKKMHQPLGYHISYQENGLYTISMASKSLGEFKDQMSAGSQVLDLLKEGAMEIKEMSELLDLKESNIRMAISRLSGKGKITKLPGNKWGLSA